MANIILDGTIGANRLLILDSTGKIPAVDGSQITTIPAGNIATGTIPIARIDTGTTANKIVVLDGTGKLPAVSGALITNIPGATKSASDPTISTNPSGGVGTEWHNTTSGEAYICTDATAGGNVWMNLGDPYKVWSGSTRSTIEPFYPYGNTSGYSCGGHIGSIVDRIDKFSFTSDGHATDVGNTALAIFGATGASSTYHGYHAGGYYPSTWTDRIARFSFAVNGDSEDVGNLFLTRQTGAGFSSSTHGYLAGGGNSTTPADQGLNGIEKYSFAGSSNGTDVGNLTMQVMSGSGTMSLTHGYRQGGRISSTKQDVIERFSFSSDGDAVDVGNLITAVSNSCGVNGQNSSTHGYCVGGEGTGNSNRIQKYQFAASSNATSVGTLPGTRAGGGGNSSTTHGYLTGSSSLNVIEKWSFTSDGNATDVGDLTLAIQGVASCSS